ncbi:MAG: hypothetical protein ACKOWF_17330, partial [Chloroflexota bacterium]
DTAGVLSTGGAARLNGCLVTGSRGGGIQLVDGAMTLADTTVTGNVDSYSGGGVWVITEEAPATLTLAGTTVVTANTAPEASGILVWEQNSFAATLVGVSSANVYGNFVGQQCERTTDRSTFTPVANCAF